MAEKIFGLYTADTKLREIRAQFEREVESFRPKAEDWFKAFDGDEKAFLKTVSETDGYRLIGYVMGRREELNGKMGVAAFDSLWSFILADPDSDKSSVADCLKVYYQLFESSNSKTYALYPGAKWNATQSTLSANISRIVHKEKTEPSEFFESYRTYKNTRKTEDLQSIIDFFAARREAKQADTLLKYLGAAPGTQIKGGTGSMEKREGVVITEEIAKAFETDKQIVLTGAPGTGKTWSARKYVDELPEEEKGMTAFVQFHPSYDYSDFVEGLRPVMVEGEKAMQFVRLDGTFKAFCRKAVQEPDRQKRHIFIIDEINRADLSKVFGELMYCLEDSYRGPSGKIPTQYSNLPAYTVEKDKAREIKDDCFAEGFYIPENVYIIGTMNDIDRSVEAFDFALRRRFRWIDVRANDVMGPTLTSMNGGHVLDDFWLDDIIGRIRAMNDVISGAAQLGLNRAYNIGPSYFKSLFAKADAERRLEIIFESKIEPLLREYCRGRNEAATDMLVESCRNALLPKAAQPDA